MKHNRDFNWTYPDFERYSGSFTSYNLTLPVLDSEFKPVASGCCMDVTNTCYNVNPFTGLHPYCNGGSDPSCNTSLVTTYVYVNTSEGMLYCNCSGSEKCEFTSPTFYHWWYRDAAGINLRKQLPLLLLPTGAPNEYYFDSTQPDNFSYIKDGFYPLSEDLWQEGVYGNKNYAFTTEVKLRFMYQGNEVFSFSGDDDVWVFINDRLALDIGGLHPRVSCDAADVATCPPLTLNQSEARLGIIPGNNYDFNVFHAERHTTSSNFKLTTTIVFLNA